MGYSEQDKVGVIPGVGPAASTALERLGIFTIADLLAWYPRVYIDGSSPVSIRQAPLDRLAAFAVTVEKVTVRPTKKRNLSMLEVTCSDESGEMLARWFNQPYLKQKLQPGTQWIFIGAVQAFRGERFLTSPLIESTPRILAVYAQTAGVTSKMLRGFINWVLQNIGLENDSVPQEMLAAQGLISRKEALHFVHQPKTMAEVGLAKQHLAFAEVFWFFVRMFSTKREHAKGRALAIPYEVTFLQELVQKLPFTLTAGQKKAIWEMVQDMAIPHPMTRLLNGDVGSGKTVVAGIGAAVVAKAGYQTILLVPTEILAKQHAQSIAMLLPELKVTVWTASQKDDLQEADLVVGTHAVLQTDFSLPRLGLVVIDEQHRFGVEQRQLLRKQATIPHTLSMTATPIPRTLALALYGDLAVSMLKEKPADRLPIMTRIIWPTYRGIMHERIVQEIEAGHQVFVICPLIEEKKVKDESGESEVLTLFNESERGAQEKKTVLAEAERLRFERPEYGRIEAIHGKLKAAEKQAIMQDMAAGKIQVLVATSVIEVGVDVPNATVMVIEGAEAFGLAQLHQFRGRVGRDKNQAYCFLVPGQAGEKVRERLQVLVDEESGFAVAEKDLQLRGPGELVGQQQSGLPDFRMASLTDLGYLKFVKGVTEEFLHKNPDFIDRHSESGYSKTLGSLE